MTKKTMIRSVSVLCLLLLGAVALPVLAGSERVERTIHHESTLDPNRLLQVENLIGSLTVRGDATDGRVLLEADVVVEADTDDAAEAIADAIQFETEERDGKSVIRVAYPLRRHSAFRLPRSERDGVMDKWVTPLVRKSTIATVYDDQTVEVGAAKGAAAVAVHLRVTVPMDLRGSFHQVAGSLQGVGLRGELTFEAVDGQILTEQIYGTLDVRTGGGEVVVRKFAGDVFRLQTASGNVSLIDVKADDAEVLTGAGRIEGNGITAASLRVDSGAGPVTLEGVDSERIEVDSQSGDVDVAARITRTREASIVSLIGDVVFRVNPTTPFELKAESADGSVKHRDLSAEVIDEEKGSVHLMRGNGGASLEVRTGKGAVTIRQL